MTILDGKKLAEKVRNELRNDVKKLDHVGLAVVLVGDDEASRLYVSMKKKACEDVGIESIEVKLPNNINEEMLISEIEKLNLDSKVDGILVQLPLPKHINSAKILSLIDPNKDVDGFHPQNVGLLVTGTETGFIPCTPLGVIKLLEEYNINPKGKNSVIVGASNIVGKPVASLLLNRNSTIDICHIYTQDLKAHTLQADILVVGVGKTDLIRGDMVKDGVVVIDIGINKLSNGKIVGDINFDEVSKKASYITPVPGGVGPMTIAMLLQNTVQSAQNKNKRY